MKWLLLQVGEVSFCACASDESPTNYLGSILGPNSDMLGLGSGCR